MKSISIFEFGSSHMVDGVLVDEQVRYRLSGSTVSFEDFELVARIAQIKLGAPRDQVVYIKSTRLNPVPKTIWTIHIHRIHTMSKTDVDMATTENAIENPITGTELSNQRQVEKLMRGIQNVLDFSVAERLTDRPEHPDNPWALMKAWRIGDDRFAGWLGWKEKDGDFAFRSHAWGILPLHEDTPLTWVDTKGMSSACPSKGQVTPINTNPYYDMMRCEPLVTQLLYVVKPAEQYGIGACLLYTSDAADE